VAGHCKVKIFLTILVLLVAAGVGGAVMVKRDEALSNRIVDALVWRLERLESRPTYRQRSFERSLLAHQRQQDLSTPPGAILLFGDSHVQFLPSLGLGAAMNYGIGGESAFRMAQRLQHYPSMNSARAIVIGGGANDIGEGRTDSQVLSAWAAILSQLPPQTRVLCLAIPSGPFKLKSEPEISARITNLNAQIKTMCERRQAEFLEVDTSVGFASDGVHLDVATNQRLIAQIKQKLER
jgi:GDSL-like Lipase/Acylhydrolase family